MSGAMTDDRAAFARARAAGLAKRQQRRLNTCHYRGCLERSVDPGARILLCETHLAQAIDLMWSRS